MRETHEPTVQTSPGLQGPVIFVSCGAGGRMLAWASLGITTEILQGKCKAGIRGFNSLVSCHRFKLVTILVIYFMFSLWDS